MVFNCCVFSPGDAEEMSRIIGTMAPHKLSRYIHRKGIFITKGASLNLLIRRLHTVLLKQVKYCRSEFKELSLDSPENINPVWKYLGRLCSTFMHFAPAAQPVLNDTECNVDFFLCVNFSYFIQRFSSMLEVIR